ncbi:hypothetical protein C7N43_33030 [Sphingobacteriales bacterium UPWRP_1]|nr:hypothetical protein C7N43_33030 [Sphingobacteriales bacterium UPWRP_1]
MIKITSQQLSALLFGGLLVFACNANQLQPATTAETNTRQTAGNTQNIAHDSNFTPENHNRQPATAVKTNAQKQPVKLPPAAAEIQNQPNKPQTVYEFPWLTQPVSQTDALQNRIAPPAGYARTAAAPGSFSAYLRSLPLKPGNPPVLLFDGSPKYNQTAQVAVFNIDPGTEDLQQCADAVMRLRAEYLWAAGQYSNIHFNYTSGHSAQYSQWRQGYRPVVSGNKVSWQKQASAQNSTSYASFRQYLKQVFTYAGTYSLSKELKPVANLADIEPGDVFIKGGMPGHAVLVVDVAQNSEGQKVFLLAQSYMPAQEIHLLQNPGNSGLSPWYSAQFTGDLITPEWTFAPNSLKRFE